MNSMCKKKKKIIKGFFKNSQKLSNSYYRQKINLPNIQRTTKNQYRKRLAKRRKTRQWTQIVHKEGGEKSLNTGKNARPRSQRLGKQLKIIHLLDWQTIKSQISQMRETEAEADMV